MVAAMDVPAFPKCVGRRPRAGPRVAWLVLIVFQTGVLPSKAQQSATVLGVESCRRLDSAGEGPPGQQGLYEIFEETVSELGAPPENVIAKPAPASFAEDLRQYVSLKAHSTLSWMASDNIFNTKDGAVEDSLYGLHTGARLHLKYGGFVLAQRYHRSFHRYQTSSSSDYDSELAGAKLSRDLMFLDDTLTVTPHVALDYSEWRLRVDDSVFFRQLSYNGGCLTKYHATDWASVLLKTDYARQDVMSNNSADDTTVGVEISGRFTPIPGYGFHVTPAFKYAHEEFRITPEQDDTHTSSLTASWAPLSFLTIHVSGSHAVNNASGGSPQASYEVLSVTTTVRAHYKW